MTNYFYTESCLIAHKLPCSSLTVYNENKILFARKCASLCQQHSECSSFNWIDNGESKQCELKNMNYAADLCSVSLTGDSNSIHYVIC